MVNCGGEAGVSSDVNVAGQVLTFPAARATDNLPVQLTSFVGREVQLAEIGRLLAKARILTLIGAGGGGETPPAPGALHPPAPPPTGRPPVRRLAPTPDPAPSP